MKWGLMLYKNRSRFSVLDKNMGRLFSKVGITPNQWTLISLLPAAAGAFLIATSNYLTASLFFALAVFFDIVDGSVARYTKRATKKGAYLDTIVDRYVETFIFIGLLFAPLPFVIVPSYIWIGIFYAGSILTTYAKSASKEKLGKDIAGGLLERAERMIILFVGILAASVSSVYLVYAIILLGILSNITAIQRISIAIKDYSKPS